MGLENVICLDFGSPVRDNYLIVLTSRLIHVRQDVEKGAEGIPRQCRIPMNQTYNGISEKKFW